MFKVSMIALAALAISYVLSLNVAFGQSPSPSPSPSPTASPRSTPQAAPQTGMAR